MNQITGININKFADKAFDYASRGVLSIKNSKSIDNALNWAASPLQNIEKKGIGENKKNLIKNYDHYLKNIMPKAIAVSITSFQGIYTLLTKDILDERKVPLAINIFFGRAFSLIGACLLTKPINKFSDKILTKFDDLTRSEENNIKERLKKINPENMKGGLKAAIPILITVIMFRFIGPVIATPFADMMTNFLRNNGYIRK